MTISWYPGHMHKARKELVKIVQNTNAVIEVLDARIPRSSANPMLATMRGDLPCIRILSKADLADPTITVRWQEHFNGSGPISCLVHSLDTPVSKSGLTAALTNLTANEQSPGARQQVLITGIPNVGKSTILNHLMDRKIAKTGNEPAVTRAQQRVRLSEKLFLVDTPGMLWPRLDDQTAAYRLAVTGTIRNTAYDLNDAAWFAAEVLLNEFYPHLEARYHLGQQPESVEKLLQTIAHDHGCIGRGGQVNWHKVSELLLNDFRTGKLGKISLETPDTNHG